MGKKKIFDQIKSLREVYQKPIESVKKFKQDEIRVIRLFYILFSVFLTFFVFFFIFNNIISMKKRAFANALAAARVAIKKDTAYGEWNSAVGGIYIPADSNIEPDPFIPSDKRSILSGGKRYLLINPSYMVRLVGNTAAEDREFFNVRTVDVDPIRPENKADEWERSALISFENKEADQVAEVVKNSAGERIFKYIAPLKVDKSCLSCHAQHAYAVGSIKGGISTDFSFEPYLKRVSAPMNQVFLTFIIVWLTVLVFLYFAARYLIINVHKKNEAINNAIEANRAKSIFFLKISHSISTPLNAIIGLSEVELRKKHSAETGGNLREINRSGANIRALVDDVLDISQIQSGKFELAAKNYDIAGVISAAANENIVRIGRLPVTFELSVDPSVPKRVRGDDRRIKQVLDKLLSNAFKHTRSGKVGFSVKKTDADDFIVWLKFIVSDTGSGIEPAKLNGIFAPKLDVDRIEDNDLSLSICKEFIEKMGGSITVESALNKGTSFIVTICQKIIENIPIGEELARQLSSFTYQETPVPEISNIEIVKMPYARVLVVDDVATNLDVAKGLLAPYEISVDCVSNADDMLEAIRNESVRYNAVFLDYMMPNVDGVEAFNLIRAEPSEYAKTIPVIALTAYSVKGAKEFFLQNGFSDYIPKPINVAELNQILNNWVRNTEQEISYKPIAVSTQDAPQKLEESNMSELLQINIPNLDVRKGIALFGATEYIKILRSFTAHTPELLKKIVKVEFATLPDYAVILHGLKGACYGVNATELGSFAGELELLAKGGNFKAVNAGNKLFLNKANSLISGINLFLSQLDDLKMSKVKVESPDKELLTALYEACLQFHITAMEDYVIQLESSEYESGGEIVTWLRRQLDNLEYESMIERLAAYLGKR
jgi:signal transduction histidine kinase/CheY-like chemotaxis protein